MLQRANANAGGCRRRGRQGPAQLWAHRLHSAAAATALRVYALNLVT